MRVLVTGVSGFLGFHVAAALLRCGHHVGAFVRGPLPAELLRSARVQLLPLVAGDAAGNRAKILSYKPDAIYHFAAVSSAAACEESPDTAWQFNTDFTQLIARVAQECDAWLCFTSTDLVFEGRRAPAGGFSEGDTICPTSVYGRSKAEAERHILNYSRGLVLRSALLYGPRAGAREGMLGWLLNGIRRGGPVKLFVDEWRTPVYVGDATRALISLLESSTTGLLHMGGAQRLSRYEFGECVCTALGLSGDSLEAVYRCDLDLRPARAEDVSLNSQRIQEVTDVCFNDVRSGLGQFLSS